MNKNFFTSLRTATTLVFSLGMVAIMLFSAVSPASAAKVNFVDNILVGLQGSSLAYGSAGSTTYLVTVHASAPMRTGNVTLSVSGLPAGVTGSFNPSGLKFTTAGSKTSTLTLSATSAAPAVTNLPFYVRAAYKGVTSGSFGTGSLTIGKGVLGVTGPLVHDRVYDGLTDSTLYPGCTAVLTTNCAGLTGVVGTDAVYLVTTNATGTFDSKDPGTQPVHVTGLSLTGAAAGNYSIPSDVVTHATISQAPLTVTSDNVFILDGETPAYTFTIGGFVNGEGVDGQGNPDYSLLDNQPTCAATSVPSPEGTAPINCSGANDIDYSFTYNNTGVLTVAQVNANPTDITLSNDTIGQNVVTGTTVGNLTTTDANATAGETYQYTFPTTPDDVGCSLSTTYSNSLFQIPSTRSNGPIPLQTAGALTVGDFNICVQTDDGHAGLLQKSFVVHVVYATDTFKSQALYDGYVLESGEFTNIGGSKSAGSAYLRVGDNALNQQYKSILSFDTKGLPDVITINSVVVKVRLQKAVGGTGPKIFKALRALTLDIAKPSIGKVGLQLTDFQWRPKATVGMNGAARLTNGTPDPSGWYSLTLVNGKQYINRTGTTQFRLRFAKDDNNNLKANFLSLFSGNAVDPNNQPQLVITYTVP